MTPDERRGITWTAASVALLLVVFAAMHARQAHLAAPPSAERADLARQPTRDALSELIARRATLGEFVIVPQQRITPTQKQNHYWTLRVTDETHVTPVFARDTQFIWTSH